MRLVSTFQFKKIFYDGDTTIQGIQVQRLGTTISYIMEYGGPPIFDGFTGYEYVYSDQNHVYQLIGDEFKVLYDFTVQPNDTILIYDSENYDPSQYECDSVGRAIVTEIGTEIINGLELRWYEVSSLDESTFYLNGKIIERMGNITQYLFGQPSDCIYIQEGNINGFRCYEDDNFPQYKPYSGECDFINSIEEITMANLGLQIYPIPANDKVNVSVSENVKVAKVRVYNVAGSMVLKPFDSAQGDIARGEIQLDVSELVSGIYLLEVETVDGFLEVKRLVIAN